MTRLVRTLIIINGFLLPAVLLTIAVIAMRPWEWFYDDPIEDHVIVGNTLDQAKQDSLILQGIRFGSPVEVYNSDNFFMPVWVKTYDEPKRQASATYEKSSANLYEYSTAYLNIVFLDRTYRVLGKLLNRKGLISDLSADGRYQSDTTVHHI